MTPANIMKVVSMCYSFRSYHECGRCVLPPNILYSLAHDLTQYKYLPSLRPFYS